MPKPENRAALFVADICRPAGRTFGELLLHPVSWGLMNLEWLVQIKRKQWLMPSTAVASKQFHLKRGMRV